MSGSRLKRALDDMNAYLAEGLPEDCRTVIWPFIDIPPIGGRPGVLLTDFRLVSREIFTNRQTLDDFLPAVACWMINDDREHLRIFAYMNDLQNYIADEYKFTLLHVTEGGTGVVFEIRQATGDETKVDRRHGTIPVR